MNAWTLFFTALGLAIAIEGLPYFVAPSMARAAVRRIAENGDGVLRGLGLTMMLIGLAVTWLALHGAG